MPKWSARTFYGSFCSTAANELETLVINYLNGMFINGFNWRRADRPACSYLVNGLTLSRLRRRMQRDCAFECQAKVCLQPQHLLVRFRVAANCLRCHHRDA